MSTFYFDLADFKPIFVRRPEPPTVRRDALVNEVWKLGDLGACFDLSAFPLPMRVGAWHLPAGACWGCAGHALHVYMRIRPRSANELSSIARGADGMLELNTCTEVSQGGFAAAVWWVIFGSLLKTS